jgi:formylmethanofuran dehydrogenase subunit C
MSGGKITVKGFAGYKVGDEMQGGEIHLKGDYGSLGYVERGLIFHKGKLVIDK